MKKLPIVIIAALMSSSPANAVDLHTALTNAYNNSDELKNIRNTFLQSTEKFPQALAGFLPDISAGITSSNIKQKNLGRYSTGRASDQKSLQKNISITQNIFNGGSDIANLKAAQASFRAARGKYYFDEQSKLSEAIEVYLNCYQTQEIFKASEINLKNYQKQLEATEAKLQAGDATKSDVALAASNVAAAENAKYKAYANFQSAIASYATVFGVEFDNVEIPNLPDNLPESLYALIQKSMISNPQLESARHSVSASKASEVAEKGNLLPQLNFSVSSGRQYFDPEPAQTGGVNNMSVTSTLSLNIPIYSKGGAEYSRIRQAKNATRASVISLDFVIKTNKANCISAWEQLKAAKAQIIAGTREVEAAEIAYNGIVEEEKVGSKTIIDVLAALEQLNTARIHKIQAETASIIAAYQIKALIGQLTAKSLKLNVKYFNPEKEFKKAKMKVIGF